MRIRITFSKTGGMRYTGHLDLHHTWERTFRRAGLPLAYSQGFNPRPRIQLASALPLGFTSQGEIMDAWLEQDLPLAEVEAGLSKALPPGLEVSRIELVDPRDPSLQSQLLASEFTITFLAPFPKLEARCSALLEAGSLMRVRRGKEYDLRPLILALSTLPGDEVGRWRIDIRLSAQPGATGRPEEVIAALGYAPEEARVHRTRLLF